MKKKFKSYSRGQIRTLLKIQQGRCAVSGMKLNPADVTVDHIIPLSNRKLANHKDYGKYWLTKSVVNTMKGQKSLNELYQLCGLILKNKAKTKRLEKIIRNKKLIEMNKKDFDDWVKKNFDKKGIIKR